MTDQPETPAQRLTRDCWALGEEVRTYHAITGEVWAGDATTLAEGLEALLKDRLAEKDAEIQRITEERDDALANVQARGAVIMRCLADLLTLNFDAAVIKDKLSHDYVERVMAHQTASAVKQLKDARTTIASLSAASGNVLDAMKNVEVRGDGALVFALECTLQALSKTAKAAESTSPVRTECPVCSEEIPANEEHECGADE